MNQAPRPAHGERLRRGVLYRRVPNTTVQWSYSRGRPTKAAFRPDVDASGEAEDGISMYLADLTTPEEVKQGHVGYAVCAIDIEKMIAAAQEKREPITVKFEPVIPAKHPADPAHCFVERVFGPLQKVLSKREDIVAVLILPGEAVDGVRVADDDDDPRAG